MRDAVTEDREFLPDDCLEEMEVIFQADLERNLSGYALLSCAIRYMLKGVSGEFILNVVEHLSDRYMPDPIENS